MPCNREATSPLLRGKQHRFSGHPPSSDYPQHISPASCLENFECEVDICFSPVSNDALASSGGWWLRNGHRVTPELRLEPRELTCCLSTQNASLLLFAWHCGRGWNVMDALILCPARLFSAQPCWNQLRQHLTEQCKPDASVFGGRGKVHSASSRVQLDSCLHSCLQALQKLNDNFVWVAGGWPPNVFVKDVALLQRGCYGNAWQCWDNVGTWVGTYAFFPVQARSSPGPDETRNSKPTGCC